MSPSSGITVAPDLASTFTNANTSNDTRFIKVSIANESLVHDRTIAIGGSFDDDLAFLQAPDVLEKNVPAYILAKKGPSDWLAISYVPDTAKVRDKMLYASTRASLLKAIGSSLFTDTIFATTKEDLIAEAYSSHRLHMAAPKPLSAREREMADVRAAENGGAYEPGSRARASHIGGGISLHWSKDAEDAIKWIGEGDSSVLVVLGIDPKRETLLIKSRSETNVEYLGVTLPPSEPCYAFYAWFDTRFNTPQRHIWFIYSCPSSSAIKDRMIYSSAVSSTYAAGQDILRALSSPVQIASRKIETASPNELNEAYLRDELNIANFLNDEQKPGGIPRDGHEARRFAKPRGPGRRR